MRHSAVSEAPAPDALLYVAGFLIVTYVWRLHAIVPGLGALRVSLVGPVVGLALVIVSAHRARRTTLGASPLLYLLATLFGLMIVGLPFSIMTGRSMHFLIWDFVPNMLMVVVIVASVRSLRDLTWLAAAHVLGAALYCVFVMRTFRVDESTGRLGDILYYDANDLALALVCTFPFVLYFLRASAPRHHRWIATPLLLMMLLIFVRTGSRGGFLGLVAVTLGVLFVFRAIRLRTRVAAIASALLCLATFGGDAYWDKMRTILNPGDDYNVTSETGRINVWKNGIKMMTQHPLVGVGARCYAPANGTISSLAEERRRRGFGAPWEVAHNSYVEIGVELGVTGLLVFLALLFTGIRTSWRLGRPGGVATRLPPSFAAMSRALMLALIGFAVSGTFLSAEYMSLLYLLFAFVMAAQKVAFIEGGALPPGDPGRNDKRPPMWRTARWQSSGARLVGVA